MTALPSNPVGVSPAAQKELDAVTCLLVQHPHLIDAYQKVRQALTVPDGYGILLVVGPPGVGKSALASASQTSVPLGPSAPAVGRGSLPGAIPLVAVAARSGTTFLSRWKALLMDILNVTNPPLAQGGQRSASALPVLSGRGLETLSIPRLESAVIESLRFRSTVGLLVDEAQDLATFDSAADSIQMAKSLKHLGSAAKTVLVMFGSYTLLNFLELEPQLSRRCSVVHFPRYDVIRPADSANFQRVLATFCSAAPTLLPYAQIAQDFPLIYAGSAGCTGNLRLWLVRSMGHAIAAGAPRVSAAELRAERLSDATIRQVIDTAQSGEALFAKLYSALDAAIASAFTGVSFPVYSLPSQPNHRRHPGKRNPRRDPINTF
jgi:hypothetical protein